MSGIAPKARVKIRALPVARARAARRTVTASRAGAAIPACLLAWVVPGAGHLYLKKIDKGLVFLAGIGALFVLGIAMDSRLEMALGLDDLLASLFSLAQMAIGVPYFLARSLGYQAGQVT